jgi:uncharacterized protein with NAD-binding domain and iron-sulfur cluster
MEWLSKHGCRYSRSALTIGMYDACFAYRKGDPNDMKMAAGTTLYGALRLCLTYKGALMWWMNAGMGETIMTPIYLALRDRGVKFEFFHKVTHVGLSVERVETIDIDVQATVKRSFKNGYEPLFLGKDGIPCWPTEPFYEQLEQGDVIQRAINPDLESWWNDCPIAGKKTLRLGQDFDLVVLGMSLGPLPYVCQDLIEGDATGGWRTMVQSVETVKTQGLQLWLNRTAAQMGWKGGPPVLCSYVEPFDTWSDMSHLIERERWMEKDNVQQIAYFCNALSEGGPPPPFSNHRYPQREYQRVKQFSHDFMARRVQPIWPGRWKTALLSKLGWVFQGLGRRLARFPLIGWLKLKLGRAFRGLWSRLARFPLIGWLNLKFGRILQSLWRPSTKTPNEFDWNLLVNCERDPKKSAFDMQFFRANIDPSERYVLSLPGTTKYRLASGDSRFENLVLAGDWTLTDLNIGCIEAAVISGRMASQAIGGTPKFIYGAFGDIVPVERQKSSSRSEGQRRSSGPSLRPSVKRRKSSRRSEARARSGAKAAATRRGPTRGKRPRRVPR